MTGRWLLVSLVLASVARPTLSASIKPKTASDVKATKELSVEERKKAIDLAAKEADLAAEQAMAEAQKEEADEQNIEVSAEKAAEQPKVITQKAVKKAVAQKPPVVDKAASGDQGKLAENVKKALGRETHMEAPKKDHLRKISVQFSKKGRTVPMDAWVAKTIEARFKDKDAHFKAVATARLKQTMMKKMKKLKMARKKKVHDSKQAQFNLAAARKAAELARLEKEEAETRAKMAALKKEKAREEARLLKAEKLKAEEEAALKKQKAEEEEARLKNEELQKKVQESKQAAEAKASKNKALAPHDEKTSDQLNVDAMVKKVVQKKRLTDKAANIAEERLKKAIHEKLQAKLAARLKKAAAGKKAAVPPAAPKAKTPVVVGFHAQKSDLVAAWVKKMLDAQIKKSGKHVSQAERLRLQKAFEAKLRQKAAVRKAAVAKKKHVDQVETFVKNAVAKKFAKSGVHVSKADEERFRKVFESKLRQKMAAKVKAVGASGGHRKAPALLHHRVVVKERDDGDSSGSDEEQDVQEADATASGDAGGGEQQSDSDAADDSEKHDEVAGQDSDGEEEHPAEDADESSADEASKDESTDSGDEEQDAEAFLQKRKGRRPQVSFAQLAARQPVAFSTNDADRLLTQVMTAAAPAPAPSASPASPAPQAKQLDPYQLCDDLCKYDTGMDADHGMCVTDCRLYADAGGDVDSLRDFVADETFNEQGGEAMEKHFESVTGKQIPDCEPTMELNPNVKFGVVDTDGDGFLTRKEVTQWGVKACVPDEIANQIFDAADSDFDNKVTAAEYRAVGEDTEIEHTLDQHADKLTEGEDQYEPVQLPAFRHVDSDSNGKLDEKELLKMYRDEIRKRVPQPADLDDLGAGELEKEMLADMREADTDGDGFINQAEYGAVHAGGMGEELSEAQAADNNLPDPDDLHREPGAGAAPSPAAAASPAAAFLAKEAF